MEEEGGKVGVLLAVNKGGEGVVTCIEGTERGRVGGTRIEQGI
jgi:hypothetical protein